MDLPVKKKAQVCPRNLYNRTSQKIVNRNVPFGETNLEKFLFLSIPELWQRVVQRTFPIEFQWVLLITLLFLVIL
jgi:hypothetical protein